MGTPFMRLVSAVLFAVVILASGFWLSRSGKPYGGLVFNLHKLVSLAGIILLVISMRRIHQAGGLSSTQLILAIISGVFFLGTMVTGGWLSVPSEKPAPAIVQQMHHITPYLTVLSTLVTLYLIKG